MKGVFLLLLGFEGRKEGGEGRDEKGERGSLMGKGMNREQKEGK